MPSPSTRQVVAYAFNQPLSFDASSVTDMEGMFASTIGWMFYVRSARALGPQALSRALSPCMPLVCAATTPQALPPPGSIPLPPASHALPSTRQGASAFNQPLSFDTSSVTTMISMFAVRDRKSVV